MMSLRSNANDIFISAVLVASNVDFADIMLHEPGDGNPRRIVPIEVKPARQEHLGPGESFCSLLNSQNADDRSKVRLPAAQILGEAVCL